MVGKLQHEDREEHCDERLSGEFLLGAQAEAALLADLEVVVEEADDPQPGHEEEHEDARPRRGGPETQVRHGIRNQRGQHDDGPTHGRGAALGVVGGRAVIADELPVTPLDEELDEGRRAEEGDDQRGHGGDEDG